MNHVHIGRSYRWKSAHGERIVTVVAPATKRPTIWVCRLSTNQMALAAAADLQELQPDEPSDAGCGSLGAR